VLLVAAVMVAAVIATVWLIRIGREQQPAPAKGPAATQPAPKPVPAPESRAQIKLTPR
jgi:hypothetical protein